MQIQQRLGDARVIRSESQRTRQSAILALEEVEQLLARRIHLGLLQIRKAGSRLRIQVGWKLGLSIRDPARRGCQQNHGTPARAWGTRAWGKGHWCFLLR